MSKFLLSGFCCGNFQWLTNNFPNTKHPHEEADEILPIQRHVHGSAHTRSKKKTLHGAGCPEPDRPCRVEKQASYRSWQALQRIVLPCRPVVNSSCILCIMLRMIHCVQNYPPVDQPGSQCLEVGVMSSATFVVASFLCAMFAQQLSATHNLVHQLAVEALSGQTCFMRRTRHSIFLSPVSWQHNTGKLTTFHFAIVNAKIRAGL